MFNYTNDRPCYPQGTREEWQRIFFISGGLYAFGFLMFMTLARGEEQDWAKEHVTQNHSELETQLTGETGKSEPITLHTTK